MATVPQFASTVTVGSGVVTTASTVTSGLPSNTVTVFTAGSSGGRVDEIDICGVGTTVANKIQIWLYNPNLASDTLRYSLIKEIAVPATTVTTTTAAYQTTLTFSNLLLPAGAIASQIVATVTVTDSTTGFRVTAFGGSF